MRILIVDDDQVVREGISKLIATIREDVEVALAANGYEALDLCRQARVDVAFADIQMPGMNGLEMIRGMKERYQVPVVVVISGHAEFEYAQRALQLSVTDYLLKPVSAAMFRSVFLNACQLARAARPEPEDEPAPTDAPSDGDPVARLLAERDKLSPIVISAIDHIMKDYTSDIMMEATAKRIYVHPAYLSDVFRRETGITFTAFLTEYRLYQAKKLLCRSNCKIYLVAEQAGFRDQRYFSRIFKRATGMTPMEYRSDFLRGSIAPARAQKP